MRNRKTKTRNERKRLRCTITLALSIVLCAIVGAMAITIHAKAPAPAACDAPVQELSGELLMDSAAPVETQEDFENEKIEAALVEQGYFRDDVPLDYDTQAYLRSACEEAGVEYELALAVIRKETTYRNVVGDGGDSYGFMQIQPRWHQDRMARLGVTDLMDPYSNFRVGCDYLAELLEVYPLDEALTCYNSGSPGQSYYADAVIGYMEELI